MQSHYMPSLEKDLTFVSSTSFLENYNGISSEYLSNLNGELDFGTENSLFENYSTMSYMDPSCAIMGSNKEQFELYGKMENESSYNLQSPSHFSNDHTLNDFNLNYLCDNHQTLLYPHGENAATFDTELDSSFNNCLFSTPNYNKSLQSDFTNTLYSENPTLQSPYYDPISRTDSPVTPTDRLVPNMQTSEYSYSYNIASPLESLMLDSASSSPSPMNTAQLVTAVYGEASDKKSPQERVPIVWHFLLRLLANPHYNPSIICWDNIDQHTFRLINPDAVASLWGERLGKPNLTRNNFARTLRYHYSNGALNQMSEQHVYQLGKKALDYLHEKARFCI